MVLLGARRLEVVTLFVQIVLARILAPEEFGIMAILLVLVNVADAVSQSGLGTALIQKSKRPMLNVRLHFG